MLPDYHLHTAFCKHATGDVAEYRSEAKKQGIPEICFTDHAPNPDGYYLDHRMALDQFSSYREMIEALQDGIEALQDGKTPEVLLWVWRSNIMKGVSGSSGNGSLPKNLTL